MDTEGFLAIESKLIIEINTLKDLIYAGVPDALAHKILSYMAMQALSAKVFREMVQEHWGFMLSWSKRNRQDVEDFAKHLETGKKWDPTQHPRDEFGMFIKKV